MGRVEQLRLQGCNGIDLDDLKAKQSKQSKTIDTDAADDELAREMPCCTGPRLGLASLIVRGACPGIR